MLAALVVVIVVGVVIAVVATRSDDDNGRPSAAAWADSVCTSIDDWRSSITSLADVSSGSLTKETLREKLDEGNEATQKLVDDLRDLGAPDLDAGDELKDKLDAGADNLQTNYDGLRSKAQDALDASSTTAFLSALAALAPPFQNLVNQISTTLQDLQTADTVSADARAELQTAFDDSEACQNLRSQD